MPAIHRSGAYAAKARAVLGGAAHRLLDLLRARRYDLALVHKEAAPLGYPLVERNKTRNRAEQRQKKKKNDSPKAHVLKGVNISRHV